MHESESLMSLGVFVSDRVNDFVGGDAECLDPTRIGIGVNSRDLADELTYFAWFFAG